MPLRPVHAPAEERAVEPQRAEVERRAADDLAGGAPRVAVVLADPQLEAGAALAAVLVVRGRQARLVDAQAAGGAEQRRPGRLRLVAGAAGRADGAQHDAAAVFEPGGRARASSRSAPSPGSPHECPRWPRQRTSCAADAPVHAAELLVAGHPAGAGRAAPTARCRPAGRWPRSGRSSVVADRAASSVRAAPRPWWPGRRARAARSRRRRSTGSPPRASAVTGSRPSKTTASALPPVPRQPPAARARAGRPPGRRS